MVLGERCRFGIEPAALDILGVNPYLASDDGGLLFIFIQPDDPHSAADTIAPFVNGVRRAVAAAQSDGVRVGFVLDGKRYEMVTEVSDWVDVEVYELINKALEEAGFADGRRQWKVSS